MTHLASMVNEGEERSRLLAWESANEDWYLFEDQHCHDTSYWFAVVSLEFSIQVAVTGCRIGCGLVPRFKQRLMIICGLLAAELAEDWFQGLSKG